MPPQKRRFLRGHEDCLLREIAEWLPECDGSNVLVREGVFASIAGAVFFPKPSGIYVNMMPQVGRGGGGGGSGGGCTFQKTPQATTV